MSTAALNALQSADFNPKEHDLAAIMESLERFGFGNPIVRDSRTGKLVAGHGRLEACRLMRDEGHEPPEGVTVADGDWLVPVHDWSSQDDAEALAFGLALNRTQDAGGYDDAALEELLRDLGEDRARLGLGIAEHELQVALGNLPSEQSAEGSSDQAAPADDLEERRLVLAGDPDWHRRMVAYLRAAAAELSQQSPPPSTPGELVLRVLEEVYG